MSARRGGCHPSGPIISSQFVRGSVNKFRPTSRCMASGIQMSVGRPTSVPLKLFADTPTIVNGWPFIRTVRPRTRGQRRSCVSRMVR